MRRWISCGQWRSGAGPPPGRPRGGERGAGQAARGSYSEERRAGRAAGGERPRRAGDVSLVAGRSESDRIGLGAGCGGE